MSSKQTVRSDCKVALDHRCTKGLGLQMAERTGRAGRKHLYSAAYSVRKSNAVVQDLEASGIQGRRAWPVTIGKLGIPIRSPRWLNAAEARFGTVDILDHNARTHLGVSRLKEHS